MRFSSALLLLLFALTLTAQHQKNPAARWDQVYLSGDSKVPVNPSALVLETTASLKPGSALDIGMGNGRNAIYLARKGWKMTGIDVSPAAVKQAASEAAKLGTQIDARVARFEDIDTGRQQYDMILCMYVQNLATKQAHKIMEALKPGGILIVEGYHSEARSMAEGSTPSNGQLGYTTNELLRAFGKLRVLRYEDRLALAEWSLGSSENRVPIVRLVAQKN